MDLIMKKIQAIAHLKAENKELKKKIEELEALIKNLEKSTAFGTSHSWGGVGGFGRQR
jgi:cell division septum initiation protein DivIVA